MGSSDGASPFASFGRRVDEHLNSVSPRIEEEVRKVIDYLNDEVVPQVRHNSSQALRIAAEQLEKLARHLESHKEEVKRSGGSAA